MTAQALAAFDAAMIAAGLKPAEVEAVIAAALDEDLRDGPDLTTEATVDPERVERAGVVPRARGVLAGGTIAIAVFDLVLGGECEIVQQTPDGSIVEPGRPVIVLRARLSGLLTAERTALNLLTHLSGIATLTRRWVDAVAGTGVAIRDTRKTLPGLRALEKYAVRCGGGINHRMSLGDAALIKDNHVAAAGSVTAAVAAVRRLSPEITLEVEVDTLEQLSEALAAGAELILLDNFSIADTEQAVRRTRAGYPGVALEASGGLTLDRAALVAATGVDYLAVGALTHSAPALDLGLDLGLPQR